uniref:Uncharacterized protein n=1 Tax=Panagrolaimus sp. ES5 TaxID=591445 RepID=A0AC34F654_9BILA
MAVVTHVLKNTEAMSHTITYISSDDDDEQPKALKRTLSSVTADSGEPQSKKARRIRLNRQKVISPLPRVIISDDDDEENFVPSTVSRSPQGKETSSSPILPILAQNSKLYESFSDKKYFGVILFSTDGTEIPTYRCILAKH